MKSILQVEKECFKTHVTYDLDCHHVMNGAFRKKSDKYGLWIYLNHNVHMWLHYTHEGKMYERELKAFAQKTFEEIYNHELWMKEFKRNYL